MIGKNRGEKGGIDVSTCDIFKKYVLDKTIVYK